MTLDFRLFLECRRSKIGMSKVEGRTSECRESKVERRESKVERRESKVESRDFTLLNLLERITHPPAKAVPLFLEGNMGNSPLEKGEQKGDVIKCQRSKVGRI